ncbi:MAG TPA: ABC transporter ATP-binding protein, partial [Acidimicrobiales bacterium]|nr:ABC transporter ATP-binding protein [Acidimicrobiales bacterium]
MSNPVVEFDGVSKFFGGVVAVSDCSFTIEPGVTALLGPNGAGKSTVMRMLCGLAAPSRGTVRLLGKDPRGAVDVFRHLGLVPQQEVVPEVLSAHEFVTLSAELSQVQGAETAARRALGLVELDPDDPRPVRTYSKGMRQRVKVAAALVHDPDIIVLDEPLEGLDPRQRRHMINLFTQLGEQDRTVIVSSHVLDEIERLATRVLVMGKGRLLAVGDFHAIRELIDDRPHKLRVVTDKPRELAAGIMADGGVVGVSILRGNVVVDTSDVAVFRASVASIAKRADARLMEVVPLDDDLESVFRYL